MLKRKNIFLIILLLISMFTLSACKPKKEQDINLLVDDLVTPQSLAELTQIVKPKVKKTSFLESFFEIFSFTIAKKDSNVDYDTELLEPESGSNYLTSKTNVQVEGVDEADSIKNDNRYIYYANSQNLKIVDSVTDKVYKHVIKDFDPQQMYLTDNYLVLFGQTFKPYREGAQDVEIEPDRPSIRRYWPEYIPTGFAIYIFDTTDVSNLKQIREIKIDESHLFSVRRIGDNYYFLLRNYQLYDSERDEAILPTYYDSIVGKKEIGLENIKIMGLENRYTAYNIIVSFNATQNEEVYIDSYVGQFDFLYSSLDNLYVTNTQYNPQASPITDEEINIFPWLSHKKDLITNIYRFEYVDEKLVYRYKTIVPGRVHDQFAMDEYNGNFRIVSTVVDDQKETFAYNFRLAKNQFELTSQVGNMGINENVYSVRFENELCYVVTFRQVDPLYIVDFSDVDEIKVIGEFKTPGYSTYLHKYNEQLLIGIGDDVDENGRILGGKISLFDVSNPDNIKEPFTYKFGGYIRFYGSHKEIIILPEAHLLGLVMNDGSYYLFTIDDVNFKIELTKKIDLLEYIERGVIVNSKVYCFSPSIICVTNLSDYETIYLTK